MTAQAQNEPRPSRRELVDEGRYVVLSDFRDKERSLAEVRQFFLDGVTRLGGRGLADRLQRIGLRRLHEIVPLEDLPELKRFVNDAIKRRIHTIAYQVGRDELAAGDDFWISDLVITRIHYPYAPLEDGRTAAAEEAYQPDSSLAGSAGRRTRNVAAAWRKYSRLFNLATIAANVPIVARQAWNAFRFRTGIGRYRFVSAGGTETAAVHGPHLDIWNGLPFEGVTMWWAIDGVTEKSGLLLYPELAHVDVPRWVETRDGQASIGMVYPAPHRIAMTNGELLLFSHEAMIHASQINVSGQTRVAISTHIALTRPVFSTDTRFAFENFYAAADVARGEFRATRFPFRRNAARRRRAGLHTIPAEAKATIVRRRGALSGGAPVRIGPSSSLAEGQKMLACLDDVGVIVARSAGRLFCVSAVCPHRGYNMVFGAQDGNRLICPGHGLVFDLRDGSSPCEGLRLTSYRVFERDGDIWIADSPAAAG